MLHYSKFYSKMVAKNHFQNGVQLIPLINRVGIVLAMLLLPVCLVAQITFAEQKPIDNNPKWWYLKDSILMPYDSASLKIQQYPLLDAYKKYVGQTLFYMGDSKVLFLSKEKIETKNKTLVAQYYAIQKEKRERERIEKFNELDTKTVENEESMFEKPEIYIYNQFEYWESEGVSSFDLKIPKNKYFDIIDVISATNIEYTKRFAAISEISPHFSFYNSWYKKKFDLTDKDFFYSYDRGRESITLENIPVFVLRETETGDTLYSTCRYIVDKIDEPEYANNFLSPFIIVGGYMKLKKELVGQTILKIYSGHYYDSETRSIRDSKIEKKWTCVDVCIADKQTRNNTDYNEENRGNNQQVTLVLQSENDSQKKYLAYNDEYEDSFLKSGDYERYYITEKQYLKNKQEKDIKEQEKQREEEKNLAEEKQKREEKIIQRKKDLTAEFGTEIAEKIIAGKFVVGMSKKACKETMQSLTNQIVSLGIPNAYMSRVVSSTATTEVWETYRADLFGRQTDGPFMHLYFNGDKLVKINEIMPVFR